MSINTGAQTEQHTIQLLLPDQQLLAADVYYNEDADECQLTLTFNSTSLVAIGDDYFDAFCAIRKQLEAHTITTWCYGASRSVYPSRMTRDMGLGLKAYKLKAGQPASTTDLVFIFDTGADVEPATVAEQQAYFEKWLASLRR